MSDATQARCPQCGCNWRGQHGPGCEWMRADADGCWQGIIDRADDYETWIDEGVPITDADWERGMPGTVLSEQAYLAGGNVRVPRYPQAPEEPRPATWFERVRRWFG